MRHSADLGRFAFALRASDGEIRAKRRRWDALPGEAVERGAGPRSSDGATSILEVEAEILIAADVVHALADDAGPGDLLILGLHQHRGRRLFGEVALQVARQTDAAVLMISHRGSKPTRARAALRRDPER